jgi:hypothetical protein
VADGDLERFLDEAEECIRQAQIATNPLDKIAWLRLAEDWIELACAAKDRDA